MREWIKIVGFCLIPIILYNGIAAFVSQVLSLIFSVYIPAYGADTKWLTANSGLLITALAGIAAAVCFLLPEIMGERRRDGGIGRKGRQEGPEPKRSIRRALLLMALASSSSIFLNVILAALPIARDGAPSLDVTGTAVSLPLLAFTVCLAAPAGEEGVFRGFSYGRLRMENNFLTAAALSSLSFGLYHGNMAQGLYGFFLGFFMCWMKEIYKTIKAPFIFHVTANGVSLIITWTAKGRIVGNKVMVLLGLCSCIVTVVLINVFMRETGRKYFSEKEKE